MGSGSFGGGGGGGGGGGITGRPVGGSGFGGYRFKLGRFFSSLPGFSKIEKTARRVRKKLPNEYVTKTFGSPAVRSYYEELFDFFRLAFQNKDWRDIAARYKVRPGRGCLLEWVHLIVKQVSPTEHNSKISDSARLAFEDFFVFALGSKSDLYLSGSDREILATLDKTVFEHASEVFLGFFIKRVIEREVEAIVPGAEPQVIKAAKKTSREIVLDFERRFLGAERTSHRDLFRVIQTEPNWFLQQFRQ